jgi:hemolysin activation/secretion protein
MYVQTSLARSLGDAGTVLRGSVSGSNNVAGRPDSASDTETSSRRMQVGLAHPLQRSRDFSLWGNLNFDALHSREDKFQRLSFEDELRVIRPSLYAYARDGWGGENGVTLEVAFGIDALGASGRGPERSRTDADGSFRKLRLDAWRSQSLFGPWSLYGQAAGQTSSQPLLSAEEFSLGGSRFGRGYDPALIAGDRGAAGALELRFTEPLSGRLTEYQLYGFYDVGRISNGTVDNNARRRLASAGTGGRLTLDQSVRLNLEIAKPLNAVEGREDRDLRTFLTLSAEF